MIIAMNCPCGFECDVKINVFISLDGLQYKKLSPKLLQKKYGELFWGREKFFSFGSVTIFF
jgi:hypothetical protein